MTEKKNAATEFSKTIARTKKAKPLAKRSEAHVPVWQRGMNEEQLAAILHQFGPLRLLASAGSGKTRVVVHRIARLVEQGADPARICAMTFSKKAADEMNERVHALGIHGARVGTWHSLCLQILKQDRTQWATWETDDKNRAKIVLKDVLGWKGMNWVGADTQAIASFIGRCKANLHDPPSPGALDLAACVFGAYNAKRAVEAFQKYNDALAEKRLLTFDDYLVFAARHLQDPEVRAMWAGRFDYGICDETQDNNGAQWTLCDLLFGGHRNFMAVGDVFQAIYAFRGSSPDYLAQFEKHWPDARTIWLPRNYRSGRAIIEAANGIIMRAKVEGHDPKPMIAERDLDGRVQARAAETLDDEAENFGAWVLDLVKSGDASHSDITALFRTNAQSRALEEALLKLRVPYVVVGGVSFYERKEVRDLLAYLRVASGKGAVEDIKRCINTPFRFLGNAFVGRVMDLVDTGSGRMKSSIDWSGVVAEVAEQAGIQKRQRESAAEWVSLIEQARDAIEMGALEGAHETAIAAARPSNILEAIIKATRYIDAIAKEEGEDSIEQSGAANVREMVRVAERFPTVPELLKYIDDTIRSARRQRDDNQAGGERVLLMSVHRSKGLEWPHVWLAGFNEMILPHAKGDQEEERRLAYVATTRARDSLVLSYVRSLATRAGIKDAHPSRFLLDSGVALDMPAPDSADDAAKSTRVDLAPSEFTPEDSGVVLE